MFFIFAPKIGKEIVFSSLYKFCEATVRCDDEPLLL